MKREQIKKMVKAVRPNYRKVKNVYYYSLGFYKDGEKPEFYKGGLTDNIPKRLYDLRSTKKRVFCRFRAKPTYIQNVEVSKEV